MQQATDTLIDVANVSKTYGTLTAVNNLSFAVTRATCVGLLGPNGAGKTTMMKMIYAKCLRDVAQDSHISVFGRDPARDELSIKFLSGVVPQEDNLDQELSVRQNLLVYAKLYGMARGMARKRIDELLAFMELGDKRDAKIKELSGGMKRRLIIVRALLNSPQLLILDEPTTGLDPQVRHLIWDKLRQLKADGLTILLTTHYMEEAFQICDSILIMHKGVKVMEGPPRRLLAERIERHVLELRGPGTRERAEGLIHDPSVRVEHGAEAVRFFSNDSGALRSLVDQLGPGEYYVRETNLEDLFLRATGSSLDEE